MPVQSVKSVSRKAGDADYELESQVGFLLRRAHQRASSIFNELTPTESLTPPQFAVLVKINQLGQVSQNQLGRLVDIDRATVQGIVLRLSQRRLITRSEDPQHKRRLLLSLSNDGKSLLKRYLKQAPLVSRKTLEPLNRAEQRELLALLERMVEH